jgi:hypothetical protein
MGTVVQQDDGNIVRTDTCLCDICDIKTISKRWQTFMDRLEKYCLN